MNKAKLKSYAPQARKDFIAAVTARANLLGLSEKAGKLDMAISQPQGDATVIAGQAWPIKVHSQRQQLIARIQKDGFAQTMEAVAYTWFNRFAALRYMELHDYLGHGHRALSSLEGALPDILAHAADLAQSDAVLGGLPGLKPELVVEMKLAGNRDGELYRLLLVAQCNALSSVMPFLFERIDDETELLLPDNLLRTDSVISKLVASIDEEDWKEVEIIGWLYQFYISERKDEVIGTVVRSEDIPAATQLFTPNWIVQYMVQNSVGRLWMIANPSSNLGATWPYYIALANQTETVQTQFDGLIQTRIDDDGGSLNPETITLLDPACGSGHILVEAYDLLKAIYLERGYQPRSIPRLILEKNLFGLDIDDRAAQMAGFALLMKARADDRRLFDEPIKLNVLALRESKKLDANELILALQNVNGWRGLNSDSDHIFGAPLQSNLSSSDKERDSWRAAIAALINTFAHAKTYGSLIQIPSALNSQLTEMQSVLQTALESGDLYANSAARDLLPLVAQAQMLAMQFDAVVANPPYMGSKGMNPALKDYALAAFPASKADLFAMFIDRGFAWCKPTGFNSMVTMQSWMFLSSFEAFRENLMESVSLTSLVHLPYDGRGPTAMGISFGISVAVFQKKSITNYRSSYDCFRYFELDDGGVPRIFPSRNERSVSANWSDFKKVPGSPVFYWLGSRLISILGEETVGSRCEVGSGLSTSDNERFVRFLWEVSRTSINIGFKTSKDSVGAPEKWCLFQKGGPFRKWYGNLMHVVNWKNDGEEIKSWVISNPADPGTTHWSRRVFNTELYFRRGITWSTISSGKISFRISDEGSMISNAAGGIFGFESDDELFEILSGLNSSTWVMLLGVLNPTLNYSAGIIQKTPFPNLGSAELCKRLVSIAKYDWNSCEISWDFERSPILDLNYRQQDLSLTYSAVRAHWRQVTDEAKTLEEQNNLAFIEALGLQNVLPSEISHDDITLFCNPHRNYSAQKTAEELETFVRADAMRDLISYIVGCAMGRFSLDASGLIYANSGNMCFDTSRYETFPADADGILPLTDELWFADEAATRVREFLLAVWGADSLVKNMVWLAESLGIKAGETPDETIRRYLADKFYKDHLQTYKKRPIYWLFSSGKQGAFQALVYLHRYHEGTLSRMRAEYVVPLTGKIQSRIDMLEKDAAAASSTAGRNKLAKEVEKLKKKHVELLAYDEQLRHHADMRITLDLDDGVKVNYGKFGDLLAEVKAVTGGASDD